MLAGGGFEPATFGSWPAPCPYRRVSIRIAECLWAGVSRFSRDGWVSANIGLWCTVGWNIR